MKSWINIFLIGVLLGTLPACQEEQQRPELDDDESVEIRPEVIFGIADGKPLYHYIESQGIVEANRSITLKTKVSGFVERSGIIEGRSVSSGDTLLKFEDEEWAVALQEARNEYEKTLSEYKLEMGMQGSVRSLTGTNGDTAGIASNSDRNEQLVRINTGLAQAELNLRKARLNLSYSVLTAPFSGILHNEDRIATGAYVSAGSEIGRLIDDRTVRVRFDVLESEINRINTGMEVTLAGPGGEELSGEVAAVAPMVDSDSKTGQIVVEIDNRSRILKPGMTVEGRIRTGAVEGRARIPRAAILERDGGRTLVFKLHGDNDEVEWIYVEPVAQNTEWAIVNHESINPGDTLAVDKHFALSHLQIVTPKMR